MKSHKLFFSFLIAIILTDTSCQDILEEDNLSGLTAEAVYATPAGFESLVNAAYSYTRAWYGKEEGFNLTEMGTDLWLPGVDNRRLDLMSYNNLQGSEAGLAATETFLERLWQRSYQAINLCNQGIKAVNQSGLTDDLKKTRDGELRFLRALYYWHIVEQWGGVHFTTDIISDAQTTANRTPVETFYNLIVEDLKVAATNLPATTAQYGRATKPAAEALLARVYLTIGKNTEASELSKKVISSYGLSLIPKYTDLWNMSNLKNKEVIFAVNYTADLTLSDLTNVATNPDGHPRGGNNGHLHFCMAYERTAAGAVGLQRDIANGRPFVRYMPTRFLLNLFNENIDSRYTGTFKTAWICNRAGVYKFKAGTKELSITMAIGDTAMVATKNEVSGADEEKKKYYIVDDSRMFKADGSFVQNAIFVQLNKFSDPSRPTLNEAQSARDAFVIRLAEMYLIDAEAQFKLGNSAAAAAAVNAVRTRAALPGKTADMQVTAAVITLDFLLDERAREFAGEQLRWFDLKRTGKLVERVKLYNPSASTFIKDFHIVRPIPQKQMDAVVNKTEFTQNQGYN